MSPSPPQPFRKLREGENVHQAWLRREFLKAVDELVPDIVLRLLRLAGPTYRELTLATGESRFAVVLEAVDDDVDDREVEGGTSKASSRSTTDPDTPEEIRFLMAETSRLVTEWARAYNLDRDPWLLNHAWLTLRSMFFEPRPRDPRKCRRLSYYAHYWHEFSAEMLWAFPSLEPGPPPLAQSTPGIHTAGTPVEDEGASGGTLARLGEDRVRAAMEAADWDIPPVWPYQPAIETRREFLERAKRHAVWVEEEYKKAGWEPEPALTDDWHNHIRWLARYQVPRPDFPNGERHRDIASCPTAPGVRATKAITERNVRMQIHKMAKLIGLTRRSEPRES